MTDPKETPVKPVDPHDLLSTPAIGALGAYFILIAFVAMYVLVDTWPTIIAVSGAPSKLASFSLFGWAPATEPTADVRLFITVAASGAIGSLVHVITSFSDYVGNGRLTKSWIWFFILRTPIGMALALILYMVLRGGLIVPAASGSGSAADTLNPYGLAATGAMAGMFSKQATDKLREVFDTLFRTRNPVDRADPLQDKAPIVASATPATLTIGGAAALALSGQHFGDGCTAFVNGEARDCKRVSDVAVELTLHAEDVAKAASLTIIIDNGASAGGRSQPFTIMVA